MSNEKYTEDHEWLRVNEDETVSIGITDYAQEQLGDIVYVELPNAGASFDANSEMAVVESVKAAGDVKVPVSCEVIEVNSRLIDEPELVNSEPYEEAWMLRIEMSDATEVDGLLDADEYKSFVEEESA